MRLVGGWIDAAALGEGRGRASAYLADSSITTTYDLEDAY